MNTMINLLNTPTGTTILVVSVPALLFLVRLLARSEGATLFEWLPSWFDIGTWPRWAQPIPPFLGGALAVLVGPLRAGEPMTETLLTTAIGAGFAAIGIYVGPRKLLVRPGARDGRKAVPKVPKAPRRLERTLPGAMLLTLMLAGCQQVQDASDYVARVCDGYLAAQPEVQAEAKRRGVSPLEVATAICLLNDAGRFIWELFEPAGADGQRMAVSAGGLESAKSRALAVARAKGELR